MNDANKERDYYVKYRLQRAKETINEIELLIEGKLLNTAINRMYYTCFYAVGALLIKNGIETSSHSATRKKFGQFFCPHWVNRKDFGKHSSLLFERRQTGNCNDFYDIDEDTVLKMHQPSVRFIAEIEKLLNQ